MRSAAAAFAWEFRQRLRWGLIALGLYFAVLAAFQFVILGPRAPVHPLESMTFAFTVNVPLAFAFMYFVSVFSYGLAGDLTARHSLYPARMFTLPISTAALAGWPMLYGTLTMAGLWVVAAVIALWPSGVAAPLLWPALFMAAFIAWLQAFAWMPYGLPGLRMIVAVLWLTTIDAVVFVALEMEVRESVMVAIMAPQIPLAYLAARYAVGRARSGDTPDWRGVFTRLGRIADVLPGRRGHFPSAARAQAWFEWRQHGRSLPVWVAILVPFEVLFLYLVRDEPPVLTMIGLVVLLLTPPFLAAFVAVTVARSNPEAGAAYGLAPFVATRPLATTGLVAAKLRMATASTLAAWLPVLVAIPVGLTLSGSWPVVLDKAGALTAFCGGPRAVAVALLCLLVLLAATWKQLVQGLAIGLTGREGLIKSSVLARLSSLVLIGLVAHFLNVSRDTRIFLWNALPWIPAVLVFLKMWAAGWIATRLHRDRLIGDRALVAAAAAWVAAVLALYGVFAWILDTPHIGHFFLMLMAILAVPLARPSAVLLAVASSRHRGTAPPAPAGVAGRRPALAAAFVVAAVPVAVAVVTCVAFYSTNRHTGGFVSSGESREYVLYVPKTYDRSRPTPLVISLHGGGLWGAVQMEMSRWNDVADEQGLIVAYPSGVGGGGPRAWRVGVVGGDRHARDSRFIAELIDTLRATYNIDPARVYADGLSNGGGMAFLLSCTLPDRIAAVSLVASAQFLPWKECRDERPVPMIAFHGTEDRFTPYHGGRSWVARDHVFPSIPGFTERWARRNRCAASPAESRVASDVTRLEYPGCADDADVVLYTIHGGGHTWPGGGPQPEWFVGTTTRSVDAARQAWEFFREHPLVAGEVLAAGPTSGAPATASPSARIARGEYVVTVSDCFTCHSPLEKDEPERPVQSRLGAGDIISEKERKVAPNLTPDRETGAGTWTDAQIVRAIRSGIGHDGRQLSLAMPYDYFSVMTDDDAASVVAYLRSLPALRNPLPRWVPIDAAETPPEPLRSPLTPAQVERAVDRGGYLARLARCGMCHTARPMDGTRRHRRLDMEFGGGRRFESAFLFDELDPDPATAAAPKDGRTAEAMAKAGVVVAPNITLDPSGIAFFDEEVFIQTIRTGRVAGIRPLSGAMPWHRLRLLTDDDLKAIFSFLQSVPPVRHRVNNSDPATWCARCGRLHGLGELNSP